MKFINNISLLVTLFCIISSIESRIGTVANTIAATGTNTTTHTKKTHKILNNKTERIAAITKTQAIANSISQSISSKSKLKKRKNKANKLKKRRSPIMEPAKIHMSVECNGKIHTSPHALTGTFRIKIKTTFNENGWHLIGFSDKPTNTEKSDKEWFCVGDGKTTKLWGIANNEFVCDYGKWFKYPKARMESNDVITVFRDDTNKVGFSVNQIITNYGITLAGTIYLVAQCKKSDDTLEILSEQDYSKGDNGGIHVEVSKSNAISLNNNKDNNTNSNANSNANDTALKAVKDKPTEIPDPVVPTTTTSSGITSVVAPVNATPEKPTDTTDPTTTQLAVTTTPTSSSTDPTDGVVESSSTPSTTPTPTPTPPTTPTPTPTLTPTPTPNPTPTPTTTLTPTPIPTPTPTNTPTPTPTPTNTPILTTTSTTTSTNTTSLPNGAKTTLQTAFGKPVGTIESGDSLYSPNRRYQLHMQTDGNLVLNDRVSKATNKIWYTNTRKAKSKVVLQQGGNLTVVASNALTTPLWQAHSGLGFASPWRLRITDDGKIEVVSKFEEKKKTIFPLATTLKEGEKINTWEAIYSPDSEYQFIVWSNCKIKLRKVANEIVSGNYFRPASGWANQNMWFHKNYLVNASYIDHNQKCYLTMTNNGELKLMKKLNESDPESKHQLIWTSGTTSNMPGIKSVMLTNEGKLKLKAGSNVYKSFN